MAFISDSTLEQVRAASDIVEIIGAVVPLKRAGANWVGLCPFHREKTPSFNVNPSKQIFRCFGCGKGGDVFKFIQEYESLSFPEAIRRLAERANIVIAEESASAGESRATKDKLLAIHEQLTQRWQSALANEASGQVARDYIVKRGISAEAVQLFRIGYAPEAWDDTVNWAKNKGFDLALVAEAGLIVPKEGGNYYDRFRGRLMFPICDEQGRVIGFSGRILSGDEKAAKYVNSPETLLFKKGRIIFGLDKAKRAILDQQFAVVCEGQLDMIACYMAGVRNAVAPQGTAFTGDQARLLKRYAKEVVLCFDSDSAGQKAAVRALDDLLQSGLSIRVATLPAPHDPDSFVKEFGAAALRGRIESAAGFFDFYLELLCKQNDIRTDRGQREAARAMSAALAKTGDKILIERYAQKTGSVLGLSPLNVLAEFKRLAAGEARTFAREPELQDEEEGQAAPPMEAPNPTEEELLFLALADETDLPWLSRHLDFHWIENDAARGFLEARLTPREDGTWPNAPQLLRMAENNPAAQAFLAKVAADPRALKEPKRQLELTLARLRDVYIARETRRIVAALASAGPAEERELIARHTALLNAKGKPLQPVSDASEL